MAKKQFKAESKRLLDLMINSIYTHKEIFLREIISNASDAIDKLCYVALTDDKVGMNRSDFAITVSVDKENRTLTVSDNGIGMSREELENNLGVIASSGSYKFRQETEEKDKKDADIDIIGQFGVGFYSAFMVADSITVRTKKYGSEQAYEWQSSGADGYTITECDKEAVGTDVIMHIKPDTDEEKYSEYLESYRLHALVKKYSDYIRYPIRMLLPEQKVKEGSAPEKPEYETVEEMKTVNSMVPLWQRKKSDVTDEEYNKFYSELTHEFDKPQRTITVSAEGSVTYKALLFVPSSRPFNFYTEGYEKGLQLYSAGVLIMDKCDSLLPDYLRFVRGVVDSPDLSLNISRELLQHDRQLKVIGQNLEKKVRADLEKFLKEDREGYEKFYENFGRQIGYGIVSDGGESRKDSLKDLMMFYSSTQKKLTTLKEYVERMKEDQKCIYYAAGENVSAIDHLPQTELLKDKNYEILYLTGETDEFVLQMLGKYADHEFRSILDGELETALKFAAERGVDVHLILPHVPDKKFAYALAKTHYKSLLDSGVKISEWLPGFVHAKVFVVDDSEAVVGTINLDYRSLYHHFENAVWMKDTACIPAIEKDFQKTLEFCRDVEPTRESIWEGKVLLHLAGILLKVIAPLL